MNDLDFLIEKLLAERSEQVNLEKLSKQEKERLFRSLCNVRDAVKISDEFLNVQDKYLQETLNKKGVVSNIENSKIEDKIYLWQGDITTLKVDGIVNAANSAGLGCFIPCHNCIDNCIHTFSGLQLRLECNEKMQKIGMLETGKAFITKGYNLPSKYVIHTVGPIIKTKVTDKEIKELENCYINCLKLALENNIKTIAFPCISTGVFRFPKEKASQIAIKIVRELINKYNNYFEKIIFNVFLDEDYKIYYNNLKRG